VARPAETQPGLGVRLVEAEAVERLCKVLAGTKPTVRLAATKAMGVQVAASPPPAVWADLLGEGPADAGALGSLVLAVRVARLVLLEFAVKRALPG
jgi:hypothetical protein